VTFEFSLNSYNYEIFSWILSDISPEKRHSKQNATEGIKP